MKLNKRLPILILCALLAAMTMVFKRFAIFNIDWLRFSLENTPILMAGVFFGPLAGFATGHAFVVAARLLLCSPSLPRAA